MLILIGYSTMPLRFASWVGFVMTIFGLGVFIYVLVVYLTAGSLPGFPFLASIIALFSGAQLFALGIFGEYLARMFDRSMDRPTYVIDKMVGE
jgi:undecaprenyl-phosphate 4-deoxy-4-formamido-L-arabinose transferase